MKPYAKAVVAVLGAALYAVQAALSDGAISPTEWVAIALAAVTAFGVWLVPNADQEGGEHELGDEG